MKNLDVKSLLLANYDIETYEPLYRKMVLLNIIILASLIGFGLFSLLNIFVLENYFISFLNFFAFLVELYAFIHIRKTGTINLASNIVTFNLFIFLLVLIYLQGGKDFTFIWTIFFPITAILLNGSIKGTIYSVVFYTIFFILGYFGIDTWQDGQWNTVSYVRLVFASLILVYVLFLIEQSFEKSYIALDVTRKKEKEYLDKLRLSSVTDHLTGLYNRRELQQLFRTSFEQAKKTQSIFAFFILDLDYFKEYNDNYGHLKGDDVLIKVALVLKQDSYKDIDSVFRLGGEEFAGFLISDSEDDIFKRIEKLRKNIENLKIVHKNNPHKVVTASFGVCIIKDFGIEDFDPIYKAADQLLYEAKESGRNCIKM